MPVDQDIIWGTEAPPGDLPLLGGEAKIPEVDPLGGVPTQAPKGELDQSAFSRRLYGQVPEPPAAAGLPNLTTKGDIRKRLRDNAADSEKTDSVAASIARKVAATPMPPRAFVEGEDDPGEDGERPGGVLGPEARKHIKARLRRRGVDELQSIALRVRELSAATDLLPGQEAARSQEINTLLARRSELEIQVASKLTSEKGWGEVALEAIETGDPIPFLGGIPRIAQATQVFNSFQAVERGDATDDQLSLLLDYDNDLRRGTTFGGGVAKILSQLPAFAGEMALTGGIYTAAKTVTKKATYAALRRTLNTVIKEKVAPRLAVRGAQLAGVVGGSLARLPFAAPHQTVEDTIRNKTGKRIDFTEDEQGLIRLMVTEEGDEFGKALAKAIGKNFVEFWSEMTGPGIKLVAGKLPGINRLKALKAAVISRWMDKVPESRVGDLFDRIRSASGWHGPLGEIGEEELGKLASYALRIDDEYHFTSPEEYLQQLVAFSIPGVVTAPTLLERKAKRGEEEAQPEAKPEAKPEAGLEAKPEAKPVAAEDVESLGRALDPAIRASIDKLPKEVAGEEHYALVAKLKDDGISDEEANAAADYIIARDALAVQDKQWERPRPSREATLEAEGAEVDEAEAEGVEVSDVESLGRALDPRIRARIDALPEELLGQEEASKEHQSLLDTFQDDGMSDEQVATAADYINARDALAVQDKARSDEVVRLREDKERKEPLVDDAVAPEVSEGEAVAAPASAPTRKTTRETAPAAEDAPKLPDDLAGAKSRYKLSELGFANDIDKALYIVANPETISDRDSDYLDWLRENLPSVKNLTDPGIRRLGVKVREHVKQSLERKPLGKGGIVEIPESDTSKGLRKPADEVADEVADKPATGREAKVTEQLRKITGPWDTDGVAEATMAILKSHAKAMGKTVEEYIADHNLEILSAELDEKAPQAPQAPQGTQGTQGTLFQLPEAVVATIAIRNLREALATGGKRLTKKQIEEKVLIRLRESLAPGGKPLTEEQIGKTKELAGISKAEVFFKDFFAAAVKLADKALQESGTAGLFPVLKKAGTVSPEHIDKAAEASVEDIKKELSDNPLWGETYKGDLAALRKLAIVSFPELEDNGLWSLFLLYNGIGSNNTSLVQNIKETVDLWSHFRNPEKGNGELGLKEGAVPPFTIRGGAQGNKKRFYGVADASLKVHKGDAAATVAYWMEMVPIKELEALRTEYKFKETPSKHIQAVVMEATGQEEKVPRAFLFGKKVGAYIMNLQGDARFTTLDVWESRGARSYFEGFYGKGKYDIPTKLVEQKAMLAWGNEVSRRLGVTPSAGQAIRWYYTIKKFAEAGYAKAQTEGSISSLFSDAIDARERVSEGSDQVETGQGVSDTEGSGESLTRSSQEGLRRLKELHEEGQVEHDYLSRPKATKPGAPVTLYQMPESQQVKSGTTFSGGGLVELGLLGLSRSKFSLEYDAATAAVHDKAHGGKTVVADIRKAGKQLEKLAGLDHHHSSPPCVCASKLQAQPSELSKAEETEYGRIVANAIKKYKNEFFTLENVIDYGDTEAYRLIAQALDDAGYTHDAWEKNVYVAADYGAPTTRKRLLVRATLTGTLPAIEKQPRGNWFDVVEDLIDGLEDAKLSRDKNGAIFRGLAAEGIDIKNLEVPILISGTTLGYSGESRASVVKATEPAFPIVASGKQFIRVVMPDGRIKRLSARAVARITGVPDTYPLPENDKLGRAIIGNGVPPPMVRAVFGPLITQVDRKGKWDKGKKVWSDRKFIPIGDKLNSAHLAESKLQRPTEEELKKDLLTKNQKGKVHDNRKLGKGTEVELRIDIRFYVDTGKYAITVKEKGGNVAGYDDIAKLKGPVVFAGVGGNRDALEKGAADVLFEGDAKSPFAVVSGEFDTSRDVPTDIDTWIPVGFNPHKATFYYNKRTGEEVLEGRDAISIGNTVYTKAEDIVYGPRTVPAGEGEGKPSYQDLKKAMEKPAAAVTPEQEEPWQITRGEFHKGKNLHGSVADPNKERVGKGDESGFFTTKSESYADFFANSSQRNVESGKGDIYVAATVPNKPLDLLNQPKDAQAIIDIMAKDAKLIDDSYLSGTSKVDPRSFTKAVDDAQSVLDKGGVNAERGPLIDSALRNAAFEHGRIHGKGINTSYLNAVLKKAGYDAVITREGSGAEVTFYVDKPELVSHRGAVQQALAEGKPVPAKVLKDYPDLAPPAKAVTPEQDRRYMAAVKAGNTKAAQKLVDAAAKRAGYAISAKHGTRAPDIREFRRSSSGEWGAGVYASPREDSAEMYGARSRGDGDVRVMPVYLRMDAPLRTSDRNVPRGMSVKAKQAAGYDGVVGTAPGGEVQYVVFDPSQIKSADPITRDEAGKVIPLSQRFDPTKESILYQKKQPSVEPKGAIEFAADGIRTVIWAFKAADPTTLIHEMAHMFRRDLTGEDLAIAEKWAGVKDGVWEREHEEKFARGFERYVSEGKAPTPELKKVFEQFRAWMARVYEAVAPHFSVLDIELTPEITELFGQILGGERKAGAEKSAPKAKAKLPDEGAPVAPRAPPKKAKKAKKAKKGSRRAVAVKPRGARKATPAKAAGPEADRPSTPVPPSDDTGAADEDVVSARKVDLEDLATKWLGHPLPSPEKYTFEEAIKEAVDNGIPDQALSLADGILGREKGERPELSVVQTAGLVIKLRELEIKAGEIGRELEVKGLSKGQKERLETVHARGLQDIDTLARALRAVGSEKGLGLVSLKIGLRRDYSIATLIRRAGTAKGEPLSESERQQLAVLTRKLEVAQADIVALQREGLEKDSTVVLRAAKARQKTDKQTTEELDTELDGLLTNAKELLRAGCYRS